MNAQRSSSGTLTPLGKFFLAIGIIIVLAACAGAVIFIPRALDKPAANNPVSQPPVSAQPTTEPNVSVVEPTAAVIAPTKIPQAVKPVVNPTANQPDDDWPPTNDTRPVVKVAFPSFGSYFTVAQMVAMDNPDRPYRLEAIPLRFTAPDGTELNPGTEAIQAQMMAEGQWDILLNTADVLSRNPTMGKWIADIDQSAGADKTVAWPVGKHTCIGKEIKIFNDLKGCSVGVMEGSVGEYQVLSFLRLTAMTPSDISIVHFDGVKDAVAAFAAGQLDAVAGWTPDIEGALEAGGLPLLDSSWLRNINDILIVSNQANNGKADLIQAFLSDWYAALKYQQESPSEAWETVANWTYGSAATSDWTYVYNGTGLADAELWLKDQVAQASLDSNLILAENPDVLVERYKNAREVWAWSGSTMGEPFEANTLIETKYLTALAANAQSYRPTSGEFITPTYMPFPASGTAPTPEQLIELPTVATFGCAQVDFSAGITTLEPGTGEYDRFVACAASLKQLILASDIQLYVTGSAAYPTTYTFERSESFARRRALGIQNALVQAGIPLERITITWVVGTKTSDEGQMQLDRWVKIEIKRDQG